MKKAIQLYMAAYWTLRLILLQVFPLKNPKSDLFHLCSEFLVSKTVTILSRLLTISISVWETQEEPNVTSLMYHILSKNFFYH